LTSKVADSVTTKGSPAGGWRTHALGLVVGLIMFFVSALPIDATIVGAPEIEAFRVVNELPGSIYWGMWAVMQMGNFVVVPVLAVIAAATRRIRLAAALAISGTMVWVSAKFIKTVVERGRPAELIDEVILHNAPAAGNGFISGHAAVAATLAAILSPYLGKRMRITVWVLAALVCVARVYVGAHLPLDVIGGAGFGLAVGSAINLLLGCPDHPGVIDPVVRQAGVRSRSAAP
jgi:membrane-associated phospholipid phosphatase